MRLVFIASCALLLLLGSSAGALQIGFETRDLADVNPGEDLRELRLTLSPFQRSAGFGVSVLFSPDLYADLQAPAPSPDWDLLLIQPDTQLPDFGRYDIQALVADPSVAQAFVVSFVWLGAGDPGPNPFEVYDPAFATVETGCHRHRSRTRPGEPAPGPRPHRMRSAAHPPAQGSAPMKSLAHALLAALAFLPVAVGCDKPLPVVHEVQIGDLTLRYQQVSSQRVNRTEFEFAFDATLHNASPVPLGELRLALSSQSAATAVVTPLLAFPSVSTGIDAPIDVPFRIRQDRTVPFDPAQLQFALGARAPALLASAPADGGADFGFADWPVLTFASAASEGAISSLGLDCGAGAVDFVASSLCRRPRGGEPGRGSARRRELCDRLDRCRRAGVDRLPDGGPRRRRPRDL